jgi:hypothetical protein
MIFVSPVRLSNTPTAEAASAGALPVYAGVLRLSTKVKMAIAREVIKEVGVQAEGTISVEIE